MPREPPHAGVRHEPPHAGVRHEPTMVHVPRSRLPVIAAVVASTLVIVAIVVGVVSRSRRPPLDSASAKPPADSVAAGPPVAAPAPAPSQPAAVVPAPAVADGAAAAAIPEPAPTEMDTLDPPAPASEAGSARKSPARTRPHGAGAAKVPAAAGRVQADTPSAPRNGAVPHHRRHLPVVAALDRRRRHRPAHAGRRPADRLRHPQAGVQASRPQDQSDRERDPERGARLQTPIRAEGLGRRRIVARCGSGSLAGASGSV